MCILAELALKKTTQCWGNTGRDPFASKGRGEPFERAKIVLSALNYSELSEPNPTNLSLSH